MAWPGRCLALGVVVATIGACSAEAASRGGSGDPPAGGAGAPAAIAAEGPGDRRVFIEGDSLTVGVSVFLPEMLASSGWTVTLDGQVGRDTPAGINVLTQRLSEIGGTLVVALGTNDEPDPAVFSTRIDQIMTIASGRRVVWVTIARAGWDRLDDALMAAQARWANLHVIDWRPVIATEPALQAADRIHLTSAGYELRAEFIAAAVKSVG